MELDGAVDPHAEHHRPIVVLMVFGSWLKTAYELLLATVWPFDLCFDRKRQYFGWLVVQNGGHSGLNSMYFWTSPALLRTRRARCGFSTDREGPGPARRKNLAIHLDTAMVATTAPYNLEC